MSNSRTPALTGTMSSAPLAGGENLPRPLTSFIGRDREIAAIQALLKRVDVRLVTLSGPGGVGKTRLALEVARNGNDVVDDIWFVPLAPVRMNSRIPAAIARAIGLHRITGKSLEHDLFTGLNRGNSLLILDNVEQLPGAGGLVSKVLRNCPNLTILATSRSLLRVSGEHVFAVPSMALPNNEHLQSPNDLRKIETVRLFVERAQASSINFSLTSHNAPAVAAICRQLDGLPLAIEFAAARVSVFSPNALTRRLDERLTLLTDGPLNEAPRLRSMRDSISWSYDLLEPDERSVFAQLAIFAGPWTLEAAETVVDLATLPRQRSVMECVIALIRNNLVRLESTQLGTSSYSMLETIRQFARELLEARDDVGNIRDRHAEFIRQLAQQTEAAMYQRDGAHVLDRLRLHLADILQVLAQLEHDCGFDELIAIASDLRVFWGMQGHVFEGRPWLERAVSLGRTSASPILGKAIVALGGLIHVQGNETLAQTYPEEGLALIPPEHVQSRFVALTTCGLIALRLEDFEKSASFQQEAFSLVGSLQPERWVTCAESSGLGHLGNVAVSQGDIESAKDYFNRSLERQTALGFVRGASHFLASHPIAGLGDVARAENEVISALGLYQEALDLATRNHDLRATLYALDGVAGSLAAGGAWMIAATLFGACEHHHERVGFPFDLETMDRQRALGLPEPWQRAGQSFGANQRLRDAVAAQHPVSISPLPDPAMAAGSWSAGRELSLDEAGSQALAARIPKAPVDTPGGLSQREIDVLRLLAQGNTDREIASFLRISRRTASTHVRHIYDKIDVSSRAGTSAWAVRHGLA